MSAAVDAIRVAITRSNIYMPAWTQIKTHPSYLAQDSLTFREGLLRLHRRKVRSPRTVRVSQETPAERTFEWTDDQGPIALRRGRLLAVLGGCKVTDELLITYQQNKRYIPLYLSS